MERFTEDLTVAMNSRAMAAAKRRIGRTLETDGLLTSLKVLGRRKVVEMVFLTTQAYQRDKRLLKQPSKERTRPVGFSDRDLSRVRTRIRRLEQAFDEVIVAGARLDPDLDFGTGYTATPSRRISIILKTE